MIYTGRLDMSPVRRKKVQTDGVDVYKTMVIDVDPATTPAPSAHLVEQVPHSTIRSHFHACSQFQVFINGYGTFGRRPVQPFVVQYVRAHTGYGPIVAGDMGLWYLTLRATPRFGAQYLPESRDKMDMTLPKYQKISDAFFPGAAMPEQPVVEMIAPQPDGLAAWMVHVTPGTAVDPPRHEGGRARYYLVAKGEMIVGGRQLPGLSLTWTEGEDLAKIEAGAEGLDVIVMQFPQDAF